jgi:hypothetical protein
MENINLETVIYNVVNNSPGLNWEKLLKQMADVFKITDRDVVYNTTNTLIDSGQICVFEPGENTTYCTPGKFKALESVRAAASRKHGDNEMSRADFDKLTYKQQHEFMKNGGSLFDSK